jgi:2-desacetyl-2-hydroxyethyl bacteriochlorophyllide A dehydrogenase
VQTAFSAISAGTELLFYRGQVPAAMSIDASITMLNQGEGVRYPLAYGYAAVGTVVAVGAALGAAEWLGRRVFAFHPHSSHFLATPADLISIPADVTLEQALFLPNMETAVNFVQDGAPLMGERVVVFGQGVVGLLTTHLLAQFPLDQLTTVDRLALRRSRATALGATVAVADLPAADGAVADADLVYELTGNPAALNDAILAAGYNGRVVIGSWYGQKRAEIDLGGHFHRNRIQLIGSQVSTIAPHLQGRWTKGRRFAVAWSMLKAIDPALLITHCFPVHAAAQAYTLLDQQPAEALQVVLTY